MKYLIKYLYLKEIINYLGVELIEKLGYEADDIMGSLSKIAESIDIESYIVSGDKDMLQMVNENIIVYSQEIDSNQQQNFKKIMLRKKWEYILIE